MVASVMAASARLMPMVRMKSWRPGHLENGLALEKWRGLILNFGSEGGFDGSGEAGQDHG
jgi:hypothetical protein